MEDSEDGMDVFPNRRVQTVPECRFDLGPQGHNIILANKKVTSFIPYEAENGKIYWKVIETTERERNHFINTMRQLKGAVNPKIEKIDWLQIERRLRRSTSTKLKKNSDIRTGFTWEPNNYLVKYAATFGVRKVRDYERHVYQMGLGNLICYRLMKQSKLDR